MGNRGAAAIEFAFVGLPFVVLTFGTFEAGHQMTAMVCLEYGARVAGRLGVTGTVGANNLPASDADRRDKIRVAARDACGAGILKDASLTVAQDSYKNATDLVNNVKMATDSPGGAQAIVRYTLGYSQQYLASSAVSTYTSTVVVVNEPFSPN